jgi:NCS1 family nucleobase:cation symporter-1
MFITAITTGILFGAWTSGNYGSGMLTPGSLIDNWDNRAASFFAAMAFALATTCTNISANSLSAANDFTALFPRVCMPCLIFIVIT